MIVYLSIYNLYYSLKIITSVHNYLFLFPKTLEEEDVHDRKLYSELGRQKKRERKLKQKGKRKRDEDQEDSSDDGSHSEPDLSWLPDPDDVYGNPDKSGSEEDDVYGNPEKSGSEEDDMPKARNM